MKVFKKIWGIYWYTVFATVFFALSPILFLMLAIKPLQRHVNWFRVQWARITFSLTLMPWQIEVSDQYKALKKDKSRKGIVFTPNHASFLDIPMFGIAVGGNMKFFAKAELTKIPIFGKLIALADIPVDRKNRRASLLALKTAADTLDKKVNLCVFPEGTTNNNAKELMPMKMGAFKIAIDKQVPVVPVTFLDNFRLFLNDGKHMARPGLSKVVIHDPIETKGMTSDDMQHLAERVRITIQAELDKHYKN